MADNTNEIEPKDRIINAAIELFAKKGYSGTGVRELAQKADVNVAMINYYFGSKAEVLKYIISDFFTRYEETVSSSMLQGGDVSTNLRTLVREVIKMFRSNTDLLRVALLEFPIDMPEISEFKANMLKKIIDTAKERLSKAYPIAEIDPAIFAICGPALGMAMASNFIMQPVIQDINMTTLDDEFYKKYPEVIADLYLTGITSVIPNTLTGKYDNLEKGEEND